MRGSKRAALAAGPSPKSSASKERATCRGATSTPRARASASAIDISSASLRSRRYVGPRSLASSATFSSPGKSGSAAVNGRHITWCWSFMMKQERLTSITQLSRVRGAP